MISAYLGYDAAGWVYILKETVVMARTRYLHILMFLFVFNDDAMQDTDFTGPLYCKTSFAYVRLTCIRWMLTCPPRLVLNY